MTAAAETQDRTTGTIRRCGRYVLATPTGPWLERFTTFRVTGEAGDRAVRREAVNLYRPVTLADGRSGVLVWPGLSGLVRAAMQASGLAVEWVESAPPPLRRVNPFRAVSPGLFDFVARNARGVIRPDVSAGVDVATLIGHVALAFPDARVVVIVGDAGDLWRRGIGRQLDDVGVSTYKTPYAGANRVVVATPGSLGTVGLDRADIVFAVAPLAHLGDDPLAAANPAPTPDACPPAGQMERLADVRGRLFAVVPRNHQPSRYEAARLAQVFGTAEYVAAGGGKTERPARVAWEPLAGGPAVGPAATPLDIKRAAVWNNPVLARRAAALANCLARGDREAIRLKFPDTAAGLDRDGPQRVLVLVESCDHADALSRRLKGWPVVTGGEAAATDDRPAVATGVIATALGVARAGNAFDALVRLDLGPGLPPLPLPTWLDTAAPDPWPLLVIDFDARGHPLLRRWTRDRRAAYVRAGWRNPSQDAGAAALARFVALTSDRRARP